ncbi:MAG: helical backbone metal receptor [Kiritimatiellae bacterium]|nr:helical backbone metal receptor [Kiritimatiellia bacterium]MDD5522862.1 helical backbone metal receptor [Kiritimatiellia bacterium]
MRRRSYITLTLCFAVIAITGCSKKQQDVSSGDRIVSLAPNMTEIVCAIGAGDVLVGRTTACNYPPEIVSKVPAVGDFGVPSFESVVAAHPTLILEADLKNEIIGRRLDEMGLRRLRVPCNSLSDIPVAIRSIGVVLHKEANANILADNLVANIEEFKRAVPKNNRPKVFMEISSDPLITAGSKSFISELVALAGGENIGDKITRQYFEISSEWVVSRNPDIILCLNKPSKGAIRNLVMKRSGWQGIAAIRQGRVYDNFNLDVISRPGPRVLQGIEELRDCIAGKKKSE